MKRITKERVIRIIFGCFMGIIAIYTLCAMYVFPNENDFKASHYQKVEKGWVLTDKDESINMNPTFSYEMKSCDNISLSMDLPQMQLAGMNLMFWVRGYRADFYVGDELRCRFGEQEKMVFGDTPTYGYAYVELRQGDEGKQLQIVITPCEGQDELKVDESYIGDRYSLLSLTLSRHILSVSISFYIMLLAIIILLITVIVEKKIGERMYYKYLVWATVLLTLWCNSNDMMRQLYSNNMSAMRDLSCFVWALLPLPLLMYSDRIQEQRRHKVHLALEYIIAAGFVFTLVTYMTGLLRLQTLEHLNYLTGIISVACIVITMSIDVFKGKFKEYLIAGIALFIFIIGCIVQVITYIVEDGVWYSSIYVDAELMIILLLVVASMIRFVKKNLDDKARAVSANKAKTQFIANMSHEIRTPINAILGMNEMILRECDDKDIKQYATDVKRAADSLLNIINDLLDSSKIEVGKMELIPVEYDISSLFNDLWNMTYVRASDKDLKLIFNIDPDMPRMYFGDDVRIRQVLLNILSNAVKYTNVGSITFTVSANMVDDENAEIYFSVKDTGIGIKEPDIDKLFGRYERLDKQHTRGIEGTGLGMSICVSFLKMMGSELKVKSEYGKGSDFYFTLRQRVVNKQPLGDFKKRIEESSKEYKFTQSFTAPDAKILVVDDNESNRKVFMGLLKNSGIRVTEASNGRSCLELLKNNSYDIIFLDHMMPEMDGIETYRIIKKLHICDNTPIIMLTANASMGAREEYMMEGFNDFLSKPIKPKDLDNMIIKYLPEYMVHFGNTNDSKGSGQDTDNITVEDNIGESMSNPQKGTEIKSIDDIKIEHFDMNTAYEYLGDVNLILEILKEFYGNLQPTLKKLLNYMKDIEDEETLKLYRVDVHALKSTSATVGANELSELAKTLEMAAKDNDVEKVKVLNPILVREISKCKKAMEKSGVI